MATNEEGCMRHAVALPVFLALVLVAFSPHPARGQSPPPSPPTREELERLASEIQALHRDYSERLAALEARVNALQAAAPAAPSPAASAAGAASGVPAPTAAAPPQATVPAGAAAGSEGGALPVYGGLAAASKVFNPDISAIGDFLGAVGKSPGGGEPSLQMHEAELGFQAVVDPYARADFFLTFSPDSVGVEEAYLTFPSLPGGLLMKVGKMRDVFGKVNGMHNHVLPWTDRPLVTQNLAGGEDGLADAGISLSRLIPNPWVFLEATGQVYRGESNIFRAPKRGDLAYLGHVRLYQDLSESSNIDLGGSVAHGYNGVGPDTTTRLFGVDATFRYKPLRRAIYTHVLVRGELVWSRREAVGSVQRAIGGYGYLEYQFARRWFAGARYDYSDRADDSTLTDKGGSFLLTYWPSEFSQVRGQLRHTHFGEGRTANELLFQFQFSIGAHGAHPF
jgi:hypothetical protein